MRQLNGVGGGNRVSEKIFENVGHKHIVIKLLDQLFEERMISVPIDRLIDLGENRHQFAQFFLQARKITVDRMELLP